MAEWQSRYDAYVAQDGNEGVTEDVRGKPSDVAAVNTVGVVGSYADSDVFRAVIEKPVTLNVRSMPFKIVGVYKGMAVPGDYAEMKAAADKNQQYNDTSGGNRTAKSPSSCSRYLWVFARPQRRPRPRTYRAAQDRGLQAHV